MRDLIYGQKKHFRQLLSAFFSPRKRTGSLGTGSNFAGSCHCDQALFFPRVARSLVVTGAEIRGRGGGGVKKRLRNLL